MKDDQRKGERMRSKDETENEIKIKIWICEMEGGEEREKDSSLPQRPSHRVGDGEALFGNFHNYYSFNAVEERIEPLVESRFFEALQLDRSSSSSSSSLSPRSPLLLLDVGCNEGNVSVAIDSHLSAIDSLC